MKLQPPTPSLAATIRPESSPNFEKAMKSFSETLSDTKLDAILKRALSSKQLNPTELLQTQIVVSKYQLKTELVTKCAEGINATLRRIQQGS